MTLVPVLILGFAQFFISAQANGPKITIDVNRGFTLQRDGKEFQAF